MPDKRERFSSLFDQLTDHQQEDIIQLMKTWAEKPSTSCETPTGGNPVSALSHHPELSSQWHCLKALKKVVDTHYPPQVELAYIAFHPNLDSVSTAKTREAAKRIYSIEAAYELKEIFEQDPDSEVLEEEILNTLQHYLHNLDKEN